MRAIKRSTVFLINEYPFTVPKMMSEAMEYLEGRQRSDPSFTYEVIIVNDGSPDNTSKVYTEIMPVLMYMQRKQSKVTI